MTRALARPLRGEVIEPAQGGADWRAEIGAWLRSCRRRGLSAHTLRTYGAALDRFTTFMEERGRSLEPREISREDVGAWMDHLERQGLSRGSRITYWAALGAAFGFLADDGVIDFVPMRKRDRPEITPDDERPVQPLRPADIDRLLHSVRGSDFDGRRDELIFRLLLSTGVRLSELTGILLDDLDEDRAEIRVYGKGSRGRGRKRRTVTYGDDTARALRAYLRKRREHRYSEAEIDLAGEHDETRTGSPLLLGRLGPLTGTGVYHIVTRRAEAAGLGHLHPHQFRHTAIDLQLRNGASDSDTMRLAGWNSTRMLGRYAAAHATERAIRNYRDPMDGLESMVRQDRRERRG